MLAHGFQQRQQCNAGAQRRENVNEKGSRAQRPGCGERILPG
jgi:hypothetical protein